jgi:hypothetical protein
LNAILLGAAAAFAVITGVAHSFLGERRIIGPLLESPSPAPAILKNEMARRVLRFAWHITTLSWIAQAIILAIVLMLPQEALARSIVLVIGVSFLMMALASIFISRGRHVGWPLLAATAASSLVALLL